MFLHTFLFYWILLDNRPSIVYNLCHRGPQENLLRQNQSRHRSSMLRLDLFSEAAMATDKINVICRGFVDCSFQFIFTTIHSVNCLPDIRYTCLLLF